MTTLPPPRIDNLEANWSVYRTMLIGLTGTPRRANAVMIGMRLQAWYGTCFASARFLGHQGAISNKAFLRTLRLLRSKGLVSVKRRVRRNGTQGTYETDFRELWRWLREAVKRFAKERRWPWSSSGRRILSSAAAWEWMQGLREWTRKGARWWWDPGGD